MELLNKIRGNCKLYLKEKTLENLLMFVQGYTYCIQQKTGKDIFLDLTDFGFYIYYIYDLEPTSYISWESILEFFCESKEAAVDAFYAHFDDFILIEQRSEYRKVFFERLDGTVSHDKIIEVLDKKENIVLQNNDIPDDSNIFYCNKFSQSDVHELFSFIRKRPSATFGYKSFKRMNYFLDGYIFCVRELTGEGIELIPGFELFVEARLDTKNNPRFNHHWSKLIPFFSSNFVNDQDQNAFDLFFEFYDSFCNNYHSS